MFSNYPFLKITPPNEEEYVFEIKKIISRQINDIYISIGRQATNDIVLLDPQKNTSRLHCSIQYKLGSWWIRDEGSANGTYLQRNQDCTEIDVPAEELIPLKNKDKILIYGAVDSSEQKLFWQLKFIDPEETNHLVNRVITSSLEYSLCQQKLFNVTLDNRNEIVLSEQELLLIDYMSRKNYEHNNQSVICTHNELIKAIWQEEDFGIKEKYIHHLASRVRKKIEPNSGEPKFLKKVRGRGYRLEINVVS